MSFGFTAEGDKNPRRLAEETGGRVEYPLENVYKDVIGYPRNRLDAGNYAMTVGTGAYASQIAQGLFRAIANVAGEVTTQYIIRYTPQGVDANKAYRNIRVEVPSLQGVKVRTRKGYFRPTPVKVVLVSTWRARPPAVLACFAGGMAPCAGTCGHLRRLSVGALPSLEVREADLVGLFFPMHTATRPPFR